MENAVIVRKENKTLDVFKYVACILIAATHLPSVFTDSVWDFYYNQWFFRFCVPFFFVSSGYFYYKSRDRKKTLVRIGWLFALSYVLYLPPILEGATDLHSVISKLRWNLIFGYEHLWYLSAAFEGMIIWFVLEKIPVVNKLFHKLGIPACVVLLLLGALLGEYYKILGTGLLYSVGEILAVFGGPRNVVFMGFPLLMFGGTIARYEEKVRKIPVLALLAAWVILRALAYWECTYLYGQLGSGIRLDLSFFGCWPAVILFALSFRFQIPVPEGFAKLLRRMAEYVYVLHPLIAMLLMRYTPMAPIPLWLTTIVLCSLIYVLLEKQFVIKKG